MTVLMRDIIEHYGVKGMRWGVRRDRKELERARKLNPLKRAGDKDPDDMTTAELKALVEDMRLRQQYNQIVDSGSTKNGSSWVGKQLEKAAGMTLSIATQQIATKLVTDAMARSAARTAARRAARAATG